ncbi:MAG: hypothetical protein J6V42_06075 [Clostridia bacterium]|nr:hypothetical protein [Clostridia bacterium]
MKQCPTCGSYIISLEDIEEMRMARTAEGQHGDPKGDPGILIDDVIANAKSEVAREILTELESELADVNCIDREFDVYLNLTIEQLKKKYTEGKKNEN